MGNNLEKIYCTIRVNGVDCPVTNLLDIDGDELTNSHTLFFACSAVAQLPDGKWLATSIDLYDLRPLN